MTVCVCVCVCVFRAHNEMNANAWFVLWQVVPVAARPKTPQKPAIQPLSWGTEEEDLESRPVSSTPSGRGTSRRHSVSVLPTPGRAELAKVFHMLLVVVVLLLLLLTAPACVSVCVCVCLCVSVCVCVCLSLYL